MKTGIYQIINNINQKRYVGYAKDIDKRWYNHKKDLLNQVHANIYLQFSYNKYGKYNFSYEILQVCSENELCFWEDYWAKILKVHDREFGYNIEPTDPNGHPSYRSIETREKMSKTKKGTNIGKNNPFYNKKHTEESKSKIGLSKLGKIGGRKGFKVTSLFTLERMSKAQLGKTTSQETKNKISKSLTGKTRTQEQKNRFSIAQSKRKKESYSIINVYNEKDILIESLFSKEAILKYGNKLYFHIEKNNIDKKRKIYFKKHKTLKDDKWTTENTK